MCDLWLRFNTYDKLNMSLNCKIRCFSCKFEVGSWLLFILSLIFTQEFFNIPTIFANGEQIIGSDYEEVPCCTHHFRHHKGMYKKNKNCYQKKTLKCIY